ncbi:hypothetical protein Agub_g10552, partial [Astrephomene gubernaculifera]
HLGLAGCSLTDASLLGLSLCAPLKLTLRHLDLSGNPGLQWDEAAWRWALMGCTALQVFNVQGAGLDTPALRALTRTLQELQELRRTLAVVKAGPPTDLRMLPPREQQEQLGDQPREQQQQPNPPPAEGSDAVQVALVRTR